MAISIKKVGSEFNDWQALLNLLHVAFEYQHALINPPSSLHVLSLQNLAEKIQSETLLVASDDKELVGCVFLRPTKNSLYIGKFAVLPKMQGTGIGRKLMNEVHQEANQLKISLLELQVRIELVENRATFETMGFVKTAETAHKGFDKMTSITMQKVC